MQPWTLYYHPSFKRVEIQQSSRAYGIQVPTVELNELIQKNTLSRFNFPCIIPLMVLYVEKTSMTSSILCKNSFQNILGIPGFISSGTLRLKFTVFIEMQMYY